MKIKLSLALSSLALLPGCFDNKKEASSKEDKSGQVLLNINGKPVLYEGEFEKVFNEFVNGREDVKQYLAMNPAIAPELKKNIFDELAVQYLFLEWVKRNNKDQTKEYQQDRKSKCDMVDRLLAMQAFQQDLMDKFAVTEEDAKKYYEENKDKVGYFKKEPFVEKHGGVKVEAVSFSSEKEANDFAQQAKGGNFKKLAKESKKTVSNLGLVNRQTPNVDQAIKAQVSAIQTVPAIIVVKGDKKFWVVNAHAKEDTLYAAFEKIKDAAKELVRQIRLPEIFKEKLDEMKKEYNYNENKNFFASKEMPTELSSTEQKTEMQEESTEPVTQANATAPAAA